MGTDPIKKSTDTDTTQRSAGATPWSPAGITPTRDDALHSRHPHPSRECLASPLGTGAAKKNIGHPSVSCSKIRESADGDCSCRTRSTDSWNRRASQGRARRNAFHFDSENRQTCVARMATNPSDLSVAQLKRALQIKEQIEKLEHELTSIFGVSRPERKSSAPASAKASPKSASATSIAPRAGLRRRWALRTRCRRSSMKPTCRRPCSPTASSPSSSP